MTYHQKYQAFYNGREWKRMRSLVWARDRGLCQSCLRCGIVREGNTVHHIVPIEENWELRLDPSNLELVCNDCHNADHDRVSALQKFLTIWESEELCRQEDPAKEPGQSQK